MRCRCRYGFAVLWVGILALVVAADSTSAVRTLWTLPLGVSPNAGQSTIAAEPDESALFVADSRGVLFAVEATTGAVRWSNPGFDGVSALYSFKDIPGILYAVTTDEELQQSTVYSIDKVDGSTLNSVQNLTGSLIWNNTGTSRTIGRLAPTAKGKKLAILHMYGIQVMDPTLSTVYWSIVNNASFGNTSATYFDSLIANDDMVMTFERVWDYGITYAPALAFDSSTGELLCRIADANDDMAEGPPFVLDAFGKAIVLTWVQESPVEYVGRWVTADFRQCELQWTTPSWAVWGSVLLPPAYRKMPIPADDTIFIGRDPISRLNGSALMDGNWAISRSHMGSNRTLWNFTLTGMPPTVGRVPGKSDRIYLLYHGFLAELNVTSGEPLWNISTVKVPFGPAFSPPWLTSFAFPLGDPNTSGRVMIPNLLGYTVVDAITQSVLEYHLDPRDPIVATFGFKGVVSGGGMGGEGGEGGSSGTEENFVICVTTAGALVALG